MYKRKLVPAIICVFLLSMTLPITLSATLSADELPRLPLDELLAAASETSMDKTRAEQALENARENMSVWSLEDSRLTGTANYTYTPEAAAEENHDFNGVVEISVPIIPQVEVIAKTDITGKGDAGLTFFPFASNEISPSDVQNYEQSLIKLDYLDHNLQSQLDALILKTAVDQNSMNLASVKLELSELSLKSAEEAYQLGENTFEELLNSRQEVSKNRENWYNAVMKNSENLKTLSLLTGQNRSEAVSISTSELEGLIASRDSYLEPLIAAALTSETLEVLQIELRKLKSEMQETWFYQPDVSASVSVGFPEPVVTGGIKFSLSPHQFQNDDREEIELEIRLKEQEIANEIFSLEIEEQMTQNTLDMLNEVLAASIHDLEKERISLAEAEYLYSLGERTSIEVKTAELNVEQAELSVFSNLTSIYLAQADLAGLYE